MNRKGINEQIEVEQDDDDDDMEEKNPFIQAVIDRVRIS